MALIIEQQPQEHSPAYNQQPWVLRDTDVTDATLSSWRVAVTVYRGTALGSPIATYLLRYRYGTGGRVVFDPMRAVESELTFDHTVRPYTLTPWATAENSIAQYTVLFGSQFYTGTEWVTKSLVTGMRYAYNAAFSDLDFAGYTQADYFIQTKALTNAPTTQTIGSNDSLWLHTLTDTASLPYDIRVRTLDAANNILNTYVYANPFTDWSGAVFIGSTVLTSNIAKRRRVRVAVGTRDLAAMDTPVSFVGAAKYTVDIRNSSGIAIASKYTFEIDDCSKYTPTRLHWLNRLGGFDAFTFKLKSKRKRNIDKSTFDRQKNVLSGGTYGYSVQSRGTVVYNTEVDWMLHVVSEPLNDTQTAWLRELAESPIVYIENSNGTFTAVTIRNKEYMIQRSQQDGIHYAEFDLEYALKDRAQRG